MGPREGAVKLFLSAPAVLASPMVACAHPDSVLGRSIVAVYIESDFTAESLELRVDSSRLGWHYDVSRGDDAVCGGILGLMGPGVGVERRETGELGIYIRW